MALVFEENFLAGRYRAVVDLLAPRSRKLGEGEALSLIGAFSFLGSMDEAEALFARLQKKRASSPALTAARFFLGIGTARKSDYASARKIFALNRKLAGKTSFERFYVLQGKVFYCYYTGRFRAALRLAERARKLALRRGDLFALALATDAYGQCRVVAGDIHHGLRLLEEARALAGRLGNKSMVNSIAVSLELHDAEFGLTGAEGVARLERRFQSVGTEDNYSQANVGLELARQYTRQGRFLEAAKILEAVAPSIYANQNRRQEITLNLRLAELAFQRGDFFGARHYLHFLDRLIHREADATFELAALGLSRKLAIIEGKPTISFEERWQGLARDFGTTRDDNLQVRLGTLSPDRENREDRVHRVLQSSRLLASIPERLKPLLENGLLGEAAGCVGLLPANPALVVLPQSLGLLIRDANGIEWNPASLSSLQGKILRLLTEGGCDKARLVELVWGYRYDALRHDPMVYSALSGLRRSLGAGARWLQATEQGYSFQARVQWPSRQAEEKSAEPDRPPQSGTLDPSLLPHLNHRQIEILEWLAAHRFVAVGECRNRFDVSEITALRDLDGLRRHGLVVRNGKARATRYSLADPGVTL